MINKQVNPNLTKPATFNFINSVPKILLLASLFNKASQARLEDNFIPYAQEPLTFHKEKQAHDWQLIHLPSPCGGVKRDDSVLFTNKEGKLAYFALGQYGGHFNGYCGCFSASSIQPLEQGIYGIGLKVNNHDCGTYELKSELSYHFGSPTDDL